MWFNPTLPPAQLKPDARSSFTFLPHDQGAVLFGGYSRVKATVSANKSAKGASQGQRNILKPMVHQDCFYLRITQPPADASPNTPPTVRWEKRKKPANTPNPPRAGATMAYHKGRGLSFGGVHDVEQSEEGIDSEFFNELFTWNIERNRFFPMALRKPRVQKKANASDQRVGRRGRAQANEEELLKQLAALQAGMSLENADDMDIDLKNDGDNEEPANPVREMPVSMEFPSPRFNALLAVQEDVLYIYGGTFESKDREYTFDDLHAIDLGKMDGCKQVFKREDESWVVSGLFCLICIIISLLCLSPNLCCYRALTTKKTRMTRMMKKTMKRTKMKTVTLNLMRSLQDWCRRANGRSSRQTTLQA